MKALAGQGSVSEGYWLRAERQSGGKGRLGRQWVSPEGNLYCSTLVEVRDADPDPSSLSFVASLAVHDLLSAFVDDGVIALKWPNDVMAADAKICGILLESTGIEVIVGIGVNIAVAPDVPGRKTACLAVLAKSSIPSLGRLMDQLAGHFASRLREWRMAGLSAVLSDWQERAHPFGSDLLVSMGLDNKLAGQFAGLAEDGALQLRLADGSLTVIYAGDVVTGSKE